MEQSPPSRTAEIAPADRESYRRFRETAFSMLPKEQSAIGSRRNWFARIWTQMAPSTVHSRQAVADYISLTAHLREPQNLRYAPAALVRISFLKRGDLELAQKIFEEIREHVLKPSPLFYLMRGALVFVVVLLLFTLSVFALSMKPDGGFFVNADVIRILVGFAAGCMGGFTSIMQRLDHFVLLIDRPRDYLSWTGFALPVVGGNAGCILSNGASLKSTKYFSGRSR